VRPHFDDGTRADPSSAGVEEAYREMASSTRALEELLQVPVVSFACPKLLFLGSVPRGSGSRGLPGGRDMCRGTGWLSHELASESIEALDRQVSVVAPTYNASGSITHRCARNGSGASSTTREGSRGDMARTAGR